MSSSEQHAKQRIVMCISYDGARYHGWQIQEALSTVQLKVEQALSRVANHAVHVVCAGRTDARVHACAQIIHFDANVERSDHAWVFGTNSNLPSDISVLWAKPVADSFHARFSAKARRYRYILYNHDVKPAILRNAVGWWYKPLDEKLMQAAGHYLLGEHDFSSFRGSGCQSQSPVRRLSLLDVRRMGRMIVLEVQANAFLLHMVRNITGVLVAIGSGERPVSWMQEVLAQRDRRTAGVTISPNGLYLVEVMYSPDFKLPRVPLGPFFLP